MSSGSSDRIRQRMVAAAHDGVEIDLDSDDAWFDREDPGGIWIIRWRLPNGKIATITRPTEASARAHVGTMLKQSWCGEIGLLWAASVTGGPALQQAWSAPKKPAQPPSREPQREGGTPLAELLLDDAETWPDGRLRVWCHRLPLLLLATPTGARIDLGGYPRQGGPPTEEQLDDVAHWRVVAEIADGGETQWLALAGWAISCLYPAYQRRIGASHPCLERVDYLLRAQAGKVVQPQNPQGKGKPMPTPPSAPGGIVNPLPGIVNLPSGIVNLKGRQYKTVALRVQEFREAHPITDGWSIACEIVSLDGDSVLMRASIKSPQGIEVAVGFAEEKRSKSGINSTSAIENCETSAIGRALAAAGYAGTEYASADELVNALNQQQHPARPELSVAPPPEHPSWEGAREAFMRALQPLGVTLAQVDAWCGGRERLRPSQMDETARSKALAWLQGVGAAVVAAETGAA